jgi:hypothetical protein
VSVELGLIELLQEIIILAAATKIKNFNMFSIFLFSGSSFSVRSAFIGLPIINASN